MYGYLSFVGFSLLKLSYFTAAPSPHPLETVSPEVLWVWTWRTARSASNAGVLQGRHPTEVAPPEHEGFFDRLYEHFFKGSWVFPGEVSTEQWSTLNHFLVKIVFSNIFLVSF